MLILSGISPLPARAFNFDAKLAANLNQSSSKNSSQESEKDEYDLIRADQEDNTRLNRII